MKKHWVGIIEGKSLKKYPLDYELMRFQKLKPKIINYSGGFGALPVLHCMVGD